MIRVTVTMLLTAAMVVVVSAYDLSTVPERFVSGGDPLPGGNGPVPTCTHVMYMVDCNYEPGRVCGVQHPGAFTPWFWQTASWTAQPSDNFKCVNSGPGRCAVTTLFPPKDGCVP